MSSASRVPRIALLFTLVGFAAVPQDDEIALTALRSRAAMVRSMNIAVRAMGASADGSTSGDTWRSGLLTSHKEVRSRSNDIIDVGTSAVVIAKLRGNLPDSVKATFHAEVSATVPLTSSDRSAIARGLLIEAVLRTNQALRTDPSN